ncbi:MAG: hypothetical protein R3D63_13630 [Paracoccaceae bacterium]
MAKADVLLAARPEDLVYLRDRLVAANRLGDARSAAGDLAGAVTDFTTMANAAYQVSAADPYNTGAAWEYALAMIRRGETRLALNDSAGARADLEVGVSVRQWLAEQDKENIPAQRDLAFALQRLADTHYAEKNLDAGRPLEEQALAILRWIDQSQPDDLWNIIDVATALDRLSSYHTDDPAYLTESLQLLEKLQARGDLPEQYLSWIENDRRVLGLN